MKFTKVILLAVSVCLLSGCYDNSYRGFVDIVEDQSKHLAGTHPIWVLVGMPSIPKAEAWSQSKAVPEPEKNGIGAVETIDSFSETPFYVYAFNQNENTDMRVMSNGEDGVDHCLMDAMSVDYSDIEPSEDDVMHLGGQKAYFSRMHSAYATWVPPGQQSPKTLYWPTGSSQGNCYNFFAYFIDNLKPKKIERNRNEIFLYLEITGGEDLMSSVAMPDLQELFKDAEGNPKLWQQLENFRDIYCYSYKSVADRSLYPKFVFNHHLVRLDFHVIPGNTTDRGYVNTITIDTVAVRSRYAAKFKVATATKNIDKIRQTSDLGVEFDNSRWKWMYLLDEEKNMATCTFTTDSDDNVEQKDKAIRFGRSVIVAPTYEDKLDYEIWVRMTETRTYLDGTRPTTRSIYENSFSLRNTKSKCFEPGNLYNIYFRISGQESIDASTDLVQWIPGGNDEYDNEQRPGTPAPITDEN